MSQNAEKPNKSDKVVNNEPVSKKITGTVNGMIIFPGSYALPISTKSKQRSGNNFKSKDNKLF